LKDLNRFHSDKNLSRPFRAMVVFEFETQGGVTIALGCVIPGFQPGSSPRLNWRLESRQNPQTRMSAPH